MLGSLILVYKISSANDLKWMILPSSMWTLIIYPLDVSILMCTPIMLATSEKERMFAMDDSLMWNLIGDSISSPISLKDRRPLFVNINNIYSEFQFLILFSKDVFYNTLWWEGVKKYPIFVNWLILLSFILCETSDELRGACTCTTCLRAIIRGVNWLATVVARSIQIYPVLTRDQSCVVFC